MDILECIIFGNVIAFGGFVIGTITRDIIWRSRLHDNNIEFDGWDEEGYCILRKKDTYV